MMSTQGHQFTNLIEGIDVVHKRDLQTTLNRIIGTRYGLGYLHTCPTLEMCVLFHALLLDLPHPGDVCVVPCIIVRLAIGVF